MFNIAYLRTERKVLPPSQRTCFAVSAKPFAGDRHAENDSIHRLDH
jgi:hypothetical protein